MNKETAAKLGLKTQEEIDQYNSYTRQQENERAYRQVLEQEKRNYDRLVNVPDSYKEKRGHKTKVKEKEKLLTYLKKQVERYEYYGD